MTTDAPDDLPAPLKAMAFNATSRVTRQGSDELPPELTARARDLIDTGFFDASIEAIRAHPAWDSTYMGRLLMGNCLFGRKQFDAADREYEAAQILADRRSSVTRNNRAMVHLMKRELSESADLCAEASRLSPDWPGVWVTRLSALNLARDEQALAAAISEMNTRWPEWRSDQFFSERLDRDPFLTGIKQRLASL